MVSKWCFILISNFLPKIIITKTPFDGELIILNQKKVYKTPFDIYINEDFGVLVYSRRLKSMHRFQGHIFEWPTKCTMIGQNCKLIIVHVLIYMFCSFFKQIFLFVDLFLVIKISKLLIFTKLRMVNNCNSVVGHGAFCVLILLLNIISYVYIYIYSKTLTSIGYSVVCLPAESPLKHGK